MWFYKKILDAFVRVARVVLFVSVCGIVTLMLHELFIRNIFNKSFRGMTEVAGFLFLWMAFIGIPVLYDKDALITLDIVSTHVGAKVKVCFWYIKQAVAFGLGIVMVTSFAGLYPFVITEYYSSMPSFSKMWQFLPLAISGVFLSLKALYNIIDKVCSDVGGKR